MPIKYTKIQNVTKPIPKFKWVIYCPYEGKYVQHFGNDDSRREDPFTADINKAMLFYNETKARKFAELFGLHDSSEDGGGPGSFMVKMEEAK